MQILFIAPTFSVEKKEAYQSSDIIKFIEQSSKVLITYDLCNQESKTCKKNPKPLFNILIEPQKRLINKYHRGNFKDNNYDFIQSFSKGSSSTNALIKDTFNALSQDHKEKIQRVLSSRNFYMGKIDGLWGVGTSRAINKYTIDKGIIAGSDRVDYAIKTFNSLLENETINVEKLILDLASIEIPSSIDYCNLLKYYIGIFWEGKKASRICQKYKKKDLANFLIFSDGRVIDLYRYQKNLEKSGSSITSGSKLTYYCTDIPGLFKKFGLPLCSTHDAKDPTHGKIKRVPIFKISSVYDIENKRYFPLDLELGWPLVTKSTKPKSTNNNPSIKKISPEPKPEKKGIKTEEKTGLKKIGSGTGFYVSDEGYIATNNHVISKCKKVMSNGEKLLLVDKNQKLDLAILKSKTTVDSFARFTKSPARPGDDIIVLGYPFGNDAGQATITKGIVSSTKGPNNDKTLLQIDASIQPGNSGGPTIDRNGALVGITVATANTTYYFKKFGHIPQNMNFSIKSKYLTSLLDLNDIDYQFSDTKAELRASEIFETVNPSVVLLECWD